MKVATPLLAGLLLALSVFGRDHSDSLEMRCSEVPDREASLCVVSTESEMLPVNDIVFYKRIGENAPVLLEARKGDINRVWLHGFSEGGALTIIGYSEEGHPSWEIYRTEDFLEPHGHRTAVGTISEYEIHDLIKLADDGYAVVEYFHFGKGHPRCLPEYKRESARSCHISIDTLKDAASQR